MKASELPAFSSFI